MEESIVGGKSVVLRDDAILKEIEVYNAFDCRSTMQCRDWLLTLRPAEVEWFDSEQEKSAAEARWITFKVGTERMLAAFSW